MNVPLPATEIFPCCICRLLNCELPVCEFFFFGLSGEIIALRFVDEPSPFCFKGGALGLITAGLSIGDSGTRFVDGTLLVLLPPRLESLTLDLSSS